MKTLKALLTASRIRSLASPTTIQRGQDYYARNRVRSVSTMPNGIRATILGQRVYIVELTAIANSLGHHCSCPMGEQGDFCKHCVAVTISFLNDPPPEDVFPIEALRAQLAAETPARLAELILEWSADNEALQNRLYEYQALLAGPDAALAALRRSLLKALRPSPGLLPDSLSDYLESIHCALDPIEKLIPTAPAAVMEICEEAIPALERFDEFYDYDEFDEDDSDGDIMLLQDRLEALHLDAARLAQPNPIQLANRLFTFESNPTVYAFEDAAETYKDLLGPTGLAAYRELAEEAHFSRPEERDRILESVARATGRIEDMIAVLARDLSTPGRFTRIITACLRANARQHALTWAERGYKLYPDSPDLREALATEYHLAGRHQDALNLIWKSYAESPGLPLYQVLQRHALLANDWPEHRDRALGLIRSRIAASKGKQDHSALVEILLAENNQEEAWREAQAAGCASYLWLQLAEAREKKHPGDAAPIFLKRADEELARIRNSNYDVPIALLLRAAKLLKKIGALPHFHRHLASLREQHKTKRKFIDLLNKHQAKLESST
jgi:uncharacterized Zn finger protein